MTTVWSAAALVLLALTSPPVIVADASAQAARETADVLYAKREDLSSARQAAAIWTERLQKDARDFEAAWKLARAHYWLGRHAPEAERKALLEAGIRAGRAAAALEPQRAEGYFWLAANMGGLAESFGLRQGLKYRGEIKENLLRAQKLESPSQRGSADRALGRWYYKVPGLFGGSKKKSEEHLRRSLTYDPNSTATLLFLAETLIALDRRAEARSVLEKLASVPLNPEWAPEDREYKEQGRRLLTR